MNRGGIYTYYLSVSVCTSKPSPGMGRSVGLMPRRYTMTTFIASVSKLVGFMSVAEKAFAGRSFARGLSVVETAAIIKEVRS